jgi:hypothetical protein
LFNLALRWIQHVSLFLVQFCTLFLIPSFGIGDNVTPAIWSDIELFVAITCACLPAIRKLLSGWFPVFFDFGSVDNSHHPNSHSTPNRLGNVSNKSYNRTSSFRLDPITGADIELGSKNMTHGSAKAIPDEKMMELGLGNEDSHSVSIMHMQTAVKKGSFTSENSISPDQSSTRRLEEIRTDDEIELLPTIT